MEEIIGSSGLTDVEKMFVRSDNYLYTRYRMYMTMNYKFQRSWHFQVICNKLEDIMCGFQKNNIVINIPPGYGKSEIISIGMTAFGMGHEPRSKFIVCSYGVEVSEVFTSQVKDLLEEPWHKDIFPCEMDRSTSAKKYFKTTAKGEVLAASPTSKVTGHRAGTALPGFSGMIITDDTNKASDSRSEAKLSEAVRFQSETLESRKFNDTVLKLIVMQRLSEKDPSGVMLEAGWDHLCIPAVVNLEQLSVFCEGLGIDPKTTNSYKEGDVEEDEFPLWPWKLSLAKHREDKKNMDGLTYSGQYMQNPTPDGGNIIKTHQFQRYAVIPDNIQFKIVTMDTAWDEGTRNDWSVLQCWGYTGTGIYLLDQWREKVDFDKLQKTAHMFFLKHRPRTMIIENKQSGIGVIQYLKKKMVPVTAVTPSKDKVTRALDAQPSIAAGYVWIPMENSNTWIKEFTDETETFPVGKHDDQVDCLVMAVIELCLGKQFDITGIEINCPTRKELLAIVGGSDVVDVFDLVTNNTTKTENNPWLEATGM